MASHREPLALASRVDPAAGAEANTIREALSSLEEQARKARKKGLICLTCAVKTHAIASLSRVPLTNELVYKGICIKCNPEKIPEDVWKKFQKRAVSLLAKKATGSKSGESSGGSLQEEEFSQGGLSWGKDSLSETKNSFEFEGISIADDGTGTSTPFSWSICSGQEHPLGSVISDTGSVLSWEEFNMASEDPSMWAISYNQLMTLHYEAKDHYGDKFPEVTMRDINREFIVPLCEDFGTSYALHQNPAGLEVEAFVTHSWDGKFADFVESIRKVFQTFVKKPSLWICAFALIQGNNVTNIKAQIGTDDRGIESSPFVLALKAAKKFVVVRNYTTDLYSRIWCVCELIYAKKLGFVPNSTFVTGPDRFSKLHTSCFDAQATNTDDRAKILRVLLEEHDYKEIDAFVSQFRAQDSPL